MAKALKRTGWVVATGFALAALAAWPRAGAAMGRPAAKARTAVAPAAAAPSKFLAPEPQVVFDDVLQVTFSVAADERGRTVLSAESSRMQMRKTIEPDQTTLELATPDGDRLRVVTRRDSISVQHGTQSVTVTVPAKAQDLARMRRLLVDSGAARTFRALSLAVQARRAEPFFDGVVTSGALLGVLGGEAGAVDELKARFAARRAPRVRQAAWQRTSEECWDQYSRDAVGIYDEYQDCIHQRRWYDEFGRAECQLVYVVRAEMAFSWLVACNGGFMAR